MEYKTELTINLPLARVIELFDDSENLKKWQVGLMNVEHLEGTPGQAGAKTRLVYEMGKKEVIMEEEIIENNLPESIHFVFRSGTTTVNQNKNFFSETAEGHTLWRQENEFQMKGFWALMTFIAPGMFKKQTHGDMVRFKTFAEAQGA